MAEAETKNGLSRSRAEETGRRKPGTRIGMDQRFAESAPGESKARITAYEDLLAKGGEATADTAQSYPCPTRLASGH